ncbi:citrate lyase subunit beta/citryl-CoA lyase [Microbacteriaceae bacterium SG_E_30_P1]|uniref:Citrate lyase subunit beta/citryl-CoA lyase n=1 Tax=Antiquaquibacter oligotrophicus TaxID=2880260 RepID=A0ABT6KM33_9MICO|nr:CoA ester lyase [Antiquaquibacter oligotrophicus]MDH6180234.1 citrate lyase subunit beta/citryl-CoA lyase [Antiquaquibacter oligotrophicus]UDF14019.1 CoA ester lyase [Antiquaquibacter oligotrophicus]
MATSRDVSAEIARSWLLVAATKPEDFDAAEASRADQVILDVEDAVDPRRKPEARAGIVEWLSNGGSAWVRINDHASDFWSDDVDALAGLPGLRGVMLAKTEAAEHVSETFDRLRGTTPVIPLVESALGIEEAANIAKARGAYRLAFGSGDYRRDTGTSADDLAMAYPRSRLVVASRVGGLPGPIDGPTVGTNHPVLREQSSVAVALGMTGKLCLDIDQLPIINEVISPTRSDVAWAREFLADFEARGRVIRDGSDLPRLGRAEKIERLARAFGVEPA